MTHFSQKQTVTPGVTGASPMVRRTVKDTNGQRPDSVQKTSCIWTNSSWLFCLYEQSYARHLAPRVSLTTSLPKQE